VARLSAKPLQLGRGGGRRVPLAQQAQEILEQSDVGMRTARGDEVALRLGQMDLSPDR